MTRLPFTPRPWQPPIIGHILEHPRCAIWATMGTGKTVATYTALDGLFLEGAPYPALVVGPKRVARDVWPEDARKWEHLRNIETSTIMGDPATRRQRMRAPASVHTTSYDLLPWLIEEYGDAWPYRIVVGDESTRLKSLRISDHVSSKGKKYLRSDGGRRAGALAKIAHSKIERFVELSGTPAPNGLQDLWGQGWFLDAGERLGRIYTGFTKRWFRTGYDGYGLEPLPGAEKEIYARLRDICLTVDLKDYIDIAEPVFRPVYVDLPPRARTQYRDMETKFFAELESGKIIDAVNAGAKSGKLFQFASGAVYDDPEVMDDDDPRARKFHVVHDEKLEALESIVAEAAGMPILLGYRFKSDLARILRAFPKAVDISTDAGMAAFRAGKAPIGAAHPRSMGHGIDGLQDVTCIGAFFSQDWNHEERQQLIGRIGPVRQMQSGHDRAVTIYDILARDTVDEDAIERDATKGTVMGALMNAMKRRAKR